MRAHVIRPLSTSAPWIRFSHGPHGVPDRMTGFSAPEGRWRRPSRR
ncbi:hypothetical protein ACFFX0_05355 [Citricoccus parietis]|uniref:Uncharacterized protein n=1 Tax=Citricoccus parietis TaxID=592307 RepID=A0ABV5FWJ3_9MICC